MPPGHIFACQLCHNCVAYRYSLERMQCLLHAHDGKVEYLLPGGCDADGRQHPQHPTALADLQRQGALREAVCAAALCCARHPARTQEMLSLLGPAGCVTKGAHLRPVLCTTQQGTPRPAAQTARLWPVKTQLSSSESTELPASLRLARTDTSKDCMLSLDISVFCSSCVPGQAPLNARQQLPQMRTASRSGLCLKAGSHRAKGWQRGFKTTCLCMPAAHLSTCLEGCGLVADIHHCLAAPQHCTLCL